MAWSTISALNIACVSPTRTASASSSASSSSASSSSSSSVVAQSSADRVLVSFDLSSPPNCQKRAMIGKNAKKPRLGWAKADDPTGGTATTAKRISMELSYKQSTKLCETPDDTIETLHSMFLVSSRLNAYLSQPFPVTPPVVCNSEVTQTNRKADRAASTRYGSHYLEDIPALVSTLKSIVSPLSAPYIRLCDTCLSPLDS
jgi:hypothetical protein